MKNKNVIWTLQCFICYGSATGRAGISMRFVWGVGMGHGSLFCERGSPNKVAIDRPCLDRDWRAVREFIVYVVCFWIVILTLASNDKTSWRRVSMSLLLATFCIFLLELHTFLPSFTCPYSIVKRVELRLDEIEQVRQSLSTRNTRNKAVGNIMEITWVNSP